MNDLKNKKVLLESLIVDTPLKKINATEASGAPGEANTWKRVMSLKTNDTRHQGIANNLTRDEIRTIAATAEYFGAETQMIMFDLAVARYRVFDWLAMCVQGRMEKTPTKVLVYAFLKANGNIDKFIQDLRDTDYEIRTEWENIVLESLRVRKPKVVKESIGRYATGGSIESEEPIDKPVDELEDMNEAGPFVTDSYSESEEVEPAEEILANLNESVKGKMNKLNLNIVKELKVVNEAADNQEALKRATIRKWVHEDIIKVVEDSAPGMFQQKSPGNVLSRDKQTDMGEETIMFYHSSKDTRTPEQAMKELGALIEKEMHVKNRGPVYARKDVIDAVQKKGSLQQGGVEVKEAPWCQDFVFSESEGYQGREEFIGYQFLLELSMAKKSLDVRIKYSGKALR